MRTLLLILTLALVGVSTPADPILPGARHTFYLQGAGGGGGGGTPGELVLLGADSLVLAGADSLVLQAGANVLTMNDAGSSLTMNEAGSYLNLP